MCTEKDKDTTASIWLESLLCHELVSRSTGSCGVLVEIPGRGSSGTGSFPGDVLDKEPCPDPESCVSKHMSRKQNSILCACMMSFSYEYLL